jgi:hypothetical protein
MIFHFLFPALARARAWSVPYTQLQTALEPSGASSLTGFAGNDEHIETPDY